MPMMRRGPLDRYPPEWVLRQANAHVVDGSIEFHTDSPLTLYLSGGRIYAAEEGVNLLETDLADRSPSGERDARERVVARLTDVLAAGSGWYFHDPLGQHPSRGSWSWETATLLMDTRAMVHETSSMAAWTGRTVVLHETPASAITLSPDAWAVVVQLAGSASASELRAQLGWSPDRLVSALVEIEDRGALDPEAGPRPPSPPSAAPRVLAGPTAVPEPVAAGVASAADHHTGPLAPPPAIADPRSLRRRGRPGRRPSDT